MLRKNKRIAAYAVSAAFLLSISSCGTPEHEDITSETTETTGNIPPAVTEESKISAPRTETAVIKSENVPQPFLIVKCGGIFYRFMGHTLKITELDLSGLEYIGFINDIIDPGTLPENDMQANFAYKGAVIYRYSENEIIILTYYHYVDGILTEWDEPIALICSDQNRNLFVSDETIQDISI